MTKLGTKVVAASVAAVGLYGGSLYIFTAKAAAAHQTSLRKTTLLNKETALNASIAQNKAQIALDEQAIAKLKQNLGTVENHTKAIQQHTALLNHALTMLQQGQPVSTVVQLIQSGKVPVRLPKVPSVTVQHAAVTSSQPPVTTVTRASGATH